MENVWDSRAFSLLVTEKISPDLFGCFVVPHMAPAWRHDQVEQFVPDTWCFFYILPEIIYFPEIGIQKIIWTNLSCYAIFNRYPSILHLKRTKDLIPYIEQVAKIGIHI